MSCFLTGIVELSVSRIYENGKYSKEFDKCLYGIQKIGINQSLTILMGGNLPPYTLNDIKGFIPEHLKANKNITNFMITRSPEDNTSDDLFTDWQYEAGQEGYVPGEAKVFKELENFLEQMFALKEVKSMWIRYQPIFSSEVNRLKTWTDLEAQIYQQCRNSYTFQIDDFEIYKEKKG